MVASIQFIGEFTLESATTNATFVQWHSELQIILSSTKESTRVSNKLKSGTFYTKFMSIRVLVWLAKFDQGESTIL